MIETKFVIFHQPKTAGSYADRCLPNNYVLPHNKNYHYCLTNNILSKNTKLVCIVRNPLDYYISLITFWCLDKKYCRYIRNKSISLLKEEYEKNKTNMIGHPNYWISYGYSERNLVNILNNLFCEKFLIEHKKKLSKNHHTYDNYVFFNMLRLDIGFYTFSFLEQYSRKRINDIKTSEECKNEIIHIRNNFIVLNTKSIKKDLKELCIKYSVSFNDNIEKKMCSNRKKVSEYDIPDELVEKIKYKERFMIEIFNLNLY